MATKLEELFQHVDIVWRDPSYIERTNVWEVKITVLRKPQGQWPPHDIFQAEDVQLHVALLKAMLAAVRDPADRFAVVRTFNAFVEQLEGHSD